MVGQTYVHVEDRHIELVPRWLTRSHNCVNKVSRGETIDGAATKRMLLESHGQRFRFRLQSRWPVSSTSY